jgi:transposase
MKISNKGLNDVLKLLDEIIEYYKEQSPEKKRDWKTYEQRYVDRIKILNRELGPLIKESVKGIKLSRGETRGAKPKLNLEQKVTLLLLKHLFGKSNRMMAGMLAIFSLLTGIDISYKSVERLYSDQEVILALHNLHILILRKKGIETVDTGGDGTGYTLTIKENYASIAQKLKDKKSTRKQKYIFSFALMDITTRLYVAYGTSYKSEREAYKQAKKMASESGVTIRSIRLDKYFSQQQSVRELQVAFPGVQISMIPKSNATIKGPWDWKRMLFDFVTDPISFLEDYYQRNQSESGFAEDKKRTGWMIMQQKPERVDTADFLSKLWHNLFWMAD